MRTIAYIWRNGDTKVTVFSNCPIDAMEKEAYGLMILLMFFALFTGVYGIYLLQECGRNYILDKYNNMHRR
jgi:hypothetical protein